MSKHRGHAQHEFEDIDDMFDHISNLPDCILHHILSFMPTEEVVKTSILSTRWKNLWAFVPNIDFDDLVLCSKEVGGRCLPDVTSFMNFLERALRLRGASSIEKFRLSCFGSYKEYQIHSWISDAINHNVQELELVFFREDQMIPWSILNTTSLVSLKISTSYVSEIPSCSSFPCLKTLRLRSVVFPSDDDAQKLLLGCPVIEELVLLDMWMNLNNIVISSSTLKRLTIRDMLCFGAYDDPTSGCKIKIDAANLTYFKYEGYLSNEIILNNASSLVEACINIVPHPKWKKAACRAFNLFKQLQYVVSLSVSETAIESLMCTDNMGVRFPKFENLSHLTLTRGEIRTKTFGGLMDFLYLCPNLQSICLAQVFENRMRLGENDPIWLSSPSCVSNRLKTVILKKFHGYKSEICFIKCVLKYARVLERVDIWWSKCELPDVKKQTKVMTELETTERISTACVINFF